MKIRSLCAVAALASGCVVNAEPAACRDPGSVAFTAELVESSCDDFTPPDLADCLQARGSFDRDSCVVETTYFCGGVRAVAVFTFCAGERATGIETFRRIADGCRIELVMVEAG